jgi:hypothetical protein
MTVLELSEHFNISLNAAALLLDRDLYIPEGVDVFSVSLASSVSLNDASVLMWKNEEFPHG